MNMGAITVQVDSASLTQSNSTAITGVVFFDFGNYLFPEEGWNDFVVVVLCWWLSALKQIAEGCSDSETLRFMGGPLYVTINKQNNGLCRIDCFDGSTDGCSEYSGQYPLSDILDSVLCAATTIYSACFKNGWDNSDLSNLRILMKGFPEGRINR